MNAALATMRRWRASPLTFVREELKAEPDAWQRLVLVAIEQGRYRVAMKACKGPGKSTVLAWLGLWFLATRKHPKIVAVSITGDNLSANLWPEFSKWMKRSAFLSSQFVWTATRIFQKDNPETWWINARTWPKTADPQAMTETLAGLHADSVMVLLDEAGGIPVPILATAEAALANIDQEAGREAFLFVAGNTTQLDGALYEAAVKQASSYYVVSISSAPNDPNRTPRVSREWAQKQIDDYGWDSPFVLINIRGEWPPGSANALISMAIVQAAMKVRLRPEEYQDEPKVLGVDVARFGDDTTELTLRQGRAVFKPKTYRGLDTVQVAGQVGMVIQKHDPDATFIDATGIGAGVVDQLRALGFNVIGVEFGAAAVESRRFKNWRCEMWWRMAEWLKQGGALPDLGEYIGELTGPTYWFDGSGRVCLESKEDMKERGVPSPNKGDSLALTFAQPVARRDLRRELELRGLQGKQILTDYNPFAEQAPRIHTDYDPFR